VPGVALAVGLFLIGGPWALVWGFFVSTTLLWHGTFTINSLSHMFGKRRYPTTDDSKNNPILAIVTMGEGWHNNHHYYPRSARQGFFWWEVDASFYILKALEAVGLVWDLHVPTAKVRAGGHAIKGVTKPDSMAPVAVHSQPDMAPALATSDAE